MKNAYAKYYKTKVMENANRSVEKPYRYICLQLWKIFANITFVVIIQ